VQPAVANIVSLPSVQRSAVPISNLPHRLVTWESSSTRTCHCIHMLTGLSRVVSTRYTSATQYPTAGIPTAVFQSLVVALVLSRLDYCNSVLVGLPANLFVVFSRFRTRQQGSFTGYGVPSILQTRSLAFTGFAFRNASCSRSP